jgi:uncharacterized membrane protein YphA (DoxX/SURF4 family)
MSELFLLRSVVAAVFIYHALPKLKNPGGMAQAVGWKPGQVFGLGLIEFVSAVAILGGVAIKLSSLLLSIVMMGAIYHKIKKWHVPFAAQNTTGWELDLVLLAVNLTLYLSV